VDKAPAVTITGRPLVPRPQMNGSNGVVGNVIVQMCGGPVWLEFGDTAMPNWAAS
jgi:hypothetical protein